MPDGAGFELTTDQGRWRARVLINATGSWRRPFVPAYPGIGDFAGRQLHTVDYRWAGDCDGQDLVVGGGNSAAQIAADLLTRRSGRTAWVTQRPPRFLPDDVDGRKLFELATRRVGAAGAEESGVGGLGTS